MWLLRLATLLITLLCFEPQSAFASLGDCNDAAYLAQFDARLAHEHDFLCRERMRVSVSTLDGHRTIRLVHHLVADWAMRREVMDLFDEGVRASARAMAELGSMHLSDVTVLLLDAMPAPATATRYGDVAAQTDFTAGSECHIVIYLLGAGAYRDTAAGVVSHELFHCVQVANLSPAQMLSGSTGRGGGGDWWIEGSADWFATLAVTPRGYIDRRLSDFDTDSPTIPLYGMSYQAFVFFEWFGGASGPSAVLPFLQHMAATSDSNVQMAAMRAALPQAAWLEFAEAYLDRQIRYPHGAALDLHPSDGATETWSATRTVRLNAAPFVIGRGNLAFQCGRWQTTITPAPVLAAKPEGGAWGALPAEFRGETTREARFRFVTFNATGNERQAALAGTLAARCTTCIDVHEHDRCLIGAWDFESGGRLEWVRRRLHRDAQITQHESSGQSMTFNDDGTFSFGRYQGRTTITTGDAHGTGNVHSAASGRWATAGSNLLLCRDTADVGGTIRVQGPNGFNQTVNVPREAATMLRWSYECSGDSLRTEEPVGTSEPIVTTYRRRH